jgi:hypothetical protein
MESARKNGLGVGHLQALYPVAHFAGCPVREGNGGNAVGPYMALPYKESNAVGYDAGLAAAWARHYKQGSLGSYHGLVLGIVQAGQDVGGLHGHS